MNEVAHICVANFFYGTSLLLILTKKWATFWATFSQTHLDTLTPGYLLHRSRNNHHLYVSKTQKAANIVLSKSVFGPNFYFAWGLWKTFFSPFFEA
jgi:hypothetical protein